MTAPAPTPPLCVRARLRWRWARRQATLAAAAALRAVAERLDPPVEHIERARVADHTLLGVPPLNPERSTLYGNGGWPDPDLAASLARHPSVNADTRATLVEWHDRDAADDPRVRLLRPLPPRHGEDNPR